MDKCAWATKGGPSWEYKTSCYGWAILEECQPVEELEFKFCPFCGKEIALEGELKDGYRVKSGGV